MSDTHKVDPITELFAKAETSKRLNPEQHVWQRLHGKLASNKKEIKIKRQRVMLVAASFAGLFMAVSWILHTKNCLYLTDLSEQYVTTELGEDVDQNASYLKDIKLMNALLPIKASF